MQQRSCPGAYYALFLLSFISLVVGVTNVVYFLGGKVLAMLWPLSLVLAMMLMWWISRQQWAPKLNLVRTVTYGLVTILVSLLWGAFYFDLSWDGQWYHQAAVYALAEGWNPVTEPLKTFNEHNDLSIQHFPKLVWYYSAAVTATFGKIEWGKSIQVIVFSTAAVSLWDIFRDLCFSRRRAVIAVILVVMCPVVWSEITTYLVDGMLYLFLLVFSGSALAWIRTRRKVYLWLIVLSAVWAINMKFTGMVFIGVSAFFISIYLLLQKRWLFTRFAALTIGAVMLALLFFGFNPYVTNMAQRGHPLYPIMGTKAYPGVYEQTGKDSNEELETPKNLAGKPGWYSFLYTSFSRPGNAPYNDVKDAELLFPFSLSLKDWKAYEFHETRTAGFGPFYGVMLLLSIAATFLLFTTSTKNIRLPFLLAVGSIIVSLLLSRHFWWPRFLPQLWLLPVIPVLFLLLKARTPGHRLFALGCTVLIIINGLIVLAVHMNWETRSSIQLRRQLNRLAASGQSIEVFYGAFQYSVERKLENFNIRYKPVKKKTLKNTQHDTLVSVVQKYPNAVLYRVIPE
ncbi:glycosyltransferase family 39 protein [Niabella yanshanensis]|uniref:Glycosyltransferase family 39 protein n=1 Tax=Niabella yanshanensis TaxID=577386 RepID=A0ABZ0W5J4_9BACT|nr:glycosyltransferase family 39 protein [Niabella yanshanensis]WQD37300.1 glycosyltransferase family 39 protein [Niabella yanshanensis]